MSLLRKLDDFKNERDEFGIPTRAIILTNEQYLLLMQEIKEIIGRLSKNDKEYVSYFISDTKWKDIPLVVEKEVIDLRKEKI